MSGFRKFSSSFSTFSSDDCSISSGIKSLDSLVDFVPGSIICLYEDKYSTIHNTILQIFISSCESLETFCENKKIHILSCEEKLLRKFNKCENKNSIKSENLIIAWRYSNKNIAIDEGSSWDLLNKVEIDKKYVLDDLNSLLSCLKTTKRGFFIVFSIFSPLYDQFIDNSHHPKTYEMHKTFYEIRKFVKLNEHILFMSFPQYLYSDSNVNSSFGCNFSIYFDSIVKIVNNLTLPQETPLYHSFLEILKLNKPGSLRINTMESYKYGLVLKSKNIKIEKIDVEPEDIIPKTSGCDIKF